MKKAAWAVLGLAIISIILASFMGCQGQSVQDPGAPPVSVINPEGDSGVSGAEVDEFGVLTDAVSIRIGRDGSAEYAIDMYDIDAVDTMLGYLSGSALLFPTYTYSDADGFVGQSIRGSYTRDDEVEVSDIKAGELYLFSGGQLRLYFKDIEGANITATPIGYAVEAAEVAEAIPAAYEANLGDMWGVDVYFWITRN